MKNAKFLFLALAVAFFGCQQAEMIDPTEGAVKMKTVTLSTSVDGVDTKASLDSQTGAFTWQSGDLLSVLATDGKFYDFILTEGAGAMDAWFEGQIPETAQVTTVATYPRIVANGAENTVLAENTLNYILPATWNYAKDVSNVPMVATFAEGAEDMSFKQVGGVMRFPVKNLPNEAKFVVTMKDKTITGEFPVDITALGEAAMTAGTEASELVINYTSDVYGAAAEFNVPVPVGTYNNFTVTIQDAEGNALFTKDYSAENKVERATLLIMQEITVPETPMTISEVWPFFVDARVVFNGRGADEYAFYIDGAEEPVIVEVETLNETNAKFVGNRSTALIGGEFEHNSAHTVAIAMVVDGEPVAETKSEAVEFTTADVYALTTNVGTKFVTVGWDDVSVPNGVTYRNGKWAAIAKVGEEHGLKAHQRRGFEVRLLDAAGNVVYKMIPFAGHEAFTGLFSDSSWLGKANGENIQIPTALAFGYLEPGTDYYFQVRTLAEPVVFDESKGNYLPEGDTSQPCPYTLITQRGGCAWSKPFKVSTQPEHVASENEVLYEGFDDIMVHSDYMNWAPAVVPDLAQERMDWDSYHEFTMPSYVDFLDMDPSERMWTAEAFSAQIKMPFLGVLTDGDEIPYGKTDEGYAPMPEKEFLFNEYAGSLEGWAFQSSAYNRSIFPIFGAIRMGQSGSNKAGGVYLYTPALNSDKLTADSDTKCIVTVNIGYSSTGVEQNIPLALVINKYGVTGQVTNEFIIKNMPEYADAYNEYVTSTHIDENNYEHHQRYYEVKCELNLRNGDRIRFEKKHNDSSYKGKLVIGDIKIEVAE